MKILFLDFDGVLNDHRKLPGSVYCGILSHCIGYLNALIRKTDCRIVLCSAWRYQIIGGATTLRGMEYLLYTHGLIPRADKTPLLVGHTCSDEVVPGRAAQILHWLYTNQLREEVKHWCVLDDLDYGTDFGRYTWRWVQPNGTTGLRWRDVLAAEWVPKRP